MNDTKEKILITSALPYANGPLHFGHIAGAYLPGDCYARYQKLKGNDVLYICGSDEYGVAITLSAEVAKRTPEEHVEIFHKINKSFFEKIGISFDHYSRTTCAAHEPPVYDYFKELLGNGYIEEMVTEQLYSEEDDRFLADRYVIGTCPQCGYESARGDECQKCGTSYEATDLINPRSKLTDAVLQKKATKHWFLMLDRFKEPLTEWINKKQWKPNVTNFVKEYIKGLRPRAITRDSNWGLPVPLPDAEGKVLYVWFDAPIGYISSSMEWAKQQGSPDRWKEYWLDQNTKFVQFIGKDNIPFHAAIFPAMTMGQNTPYKLVDELPANEFYNLEGRQFSKSEGWYIDLENFFSKYTADQIRYTIAANAPETQDSEFTWKDFQLRCNAELLGKYGNLVNRVLVFAAKNCSGMIPLRGDLETVDKEFLQSIHSLSDKIAESYEQFKLRRASQLIMELAQQGNTYFDAKHPWKDAKMDLTFSRMETTISCCIECLKLLAMVSYPILPNTAKKVWRFLGFEKELEFCVWKDIATEPLVSGKALLKPEILFKKIEDEEIKLETESLAKMAEKAQSEKSFLFEPLKKNVDFEAFQKLDLRVGLILEVTRVAKSKKLLKLIVDLGFEKRTILSGISQHYAPEALVGKKVVIVANLKPVVIMGIKSEGMLLAGSTDSALEAVSVSDLPPGSVVR